MKKIKHWLLKDVCRLIKEAEENLSVNLYLKDATSGELIEKKEGFVNVPPPGAYIKLERMEEEYFRVDNVVFSELGFVIDLYGFVVPFPR